jgi:hypothetical protein
MATQEKFICIDGETGQQLSIGWYDTPESAQRSIEFFGRDDHFVEPVCENCGQPTRKARDNPWKRAVVRPIQISGLPEQTPQVTA